MRIVSYNIYLRVVRRLNKNPAMRKVILGVAVSLDGFIEGPNGEYDWCLTDQDYGLKEFFKRIDTIFVGQTLKLTSNGNGTMAMVLLKQSRHLLFNTAIPLQAYTRLR